MGTIEAYETARGKRYRVRYRTPDHRQTDKRGFRTKRDADLFQPVGELLPLCEQLLEAGEAAIHRIAPCIDDGRIRQDQPYQADMPEIVRHLVDEERRTLPMDAGVGDILLAKTGQLLGGQIVQNSGIARGTCLAPAQSVRQRAADAGAKYFNAQSLRITLRVPTFSATTGAGGAGRESERRRCGSSMP